MTERPAAHIIEVTSFVLGKTASVKYKKVKKAKQTIKIKVK